MRILHAVTHYDLLTGSGLYVYELTRVLARRGHDVTVVAENVGGELTARSRANGVTVVAASDLPQLPVDLLHLHQAAPGAAVLEHWPEARVVATVHSPWPGDQPLATERIHTYICVRPEIRWKVIQADGIPRQRTTMLLNGIDRSRFHPQPAATPPGRPRVLFAATISPLRRPVVLDLIDRCRARDHDLLLVGLGDPHLLGTLPPHVSWERTEVWAIEDYVREADEVAGTFVGRTAIEGWMCDKPAWVYELVPFERIDSVSLVPPPAPLFLDLCDIEYMTDAVESVYASALQ